MISPVVDLKSDVIIAFVVSYSLVLLLDLFLDFLIPSLVTQSNIKRLLGWGGVSDVVWWWIWSCEYARWNCGEACLLLHHENVASSMPAEGICQLLYLARSVSIALSLKGAFLCLLISRRKSIKNLSEKPRYMWEPQHMHFNYK